MKEQNVDKLTSAFHDFTQVVEKFEQTYKLLQDKIESLDKTVRK